MAESWEQFVVEHQGEHPGQFNKKCLVVGDLLIAGGGISRMVGHRKAANAMTLIGLGVAVTGHLVDRNLPRALSDTIRHPIWTVRGDIVVAKQVFSGEA